MALLYELLTQNKLAASELLKSESRLDQHIYVGCYTVALDCRRWIECIDFYVLFYKRRVNTTGVLPQSTCASVKLAQFKNPFFSFLLFSFLALPLGIWAGILGGYLLLLFMHPMVRCKCKLLSVMCLLYSTYDSSSQCSTVMYSPSALY